MSYVDVDDTVKQTYGYRKQGAGYGYTGVKGLNALIATVSTPLSAPIIVASRLRRGSAHSGRGAARLVADALTSARACGATGLVIVRADSAFYAAEVIAAIRRGSAYFSITARKDPAVQTAIASISEDAWTPIRYPRAVFDDQLGQWMSDAEVAEVPFTAFGSKPQAKQVSGRLIVRRVRDANPDHERINAQGELFHTWRHHAVFTDSPLGMLDAEADHRRHAVIEQVIADLKSGPLAHLPSGKFMANSAWLALTVIAFNLLRAAGTIASRVHAKATTGTIRAQLISVAARIIKSARRIRLRLPATWPWRWAWHRLFTAALAHPPPTNPSTADRPNDTTWRSRPDRQRNHDLHRVQLNARSKPLTRIAIGASRLSGCGTERWCPIAQGTSTGPQHRPRSRGHIPLPWSGHRSSDDVLAHPNRATLGHRFSPTSTRFGIVPTSPQRRLCRPGDCADLVAASAAQQGGSYRRRRHNPARVARRNCATRPDRARNTPSCCRDRLVVGLG